ncbi:MAG: DUF2232 domain-containing protein [Pseudomonadota bacterium]
MTNNWIVIGVIAGLTAGLLQAGGSSGNLIGVFLVYLASFPLFLAGLGWGALTAALGAGVMIIGHLLGFGPKAAFFAALSAGIAPVVLSHLALQNRPASATPSDEGEVADTGIEWYPEGRLIVWTAIASAALSVSVMIAIGPDVETFRATVGETLQPVFVEMAKQPNSPDADQIRSFFVLIMPAALSVFWCMSTMVNMYLAGSLLRRTGAGSRPWAPFSQLAFPRWAIWVLSASAVATFVPGTLGAFAWVFTAALMLAYAILGLAVMHSLLANHPLRGLLLGIFYLSLMFLSVVWIAFVIMLAMFDQSFNIRKRNKPPD